MMVFQCFPKGSGFFKSLRCKSRRAQGIHQNIADILIIFNGPDFTQSKYRAGKITGCPFCFFACFFRLAGEIQLVLFGFYLFGSLSVIFLLHNTLIINRLIKKRRLFERLDRLQAALASKPIERINSVSLDYKPVEAVDPNFSARILHPPDADSAEKYVHSSLLLQKPARHFASGCFQYKHAGFPPASV